MGNHLVDIVNEKDEVVGFDYKEMKESKDFISRVVAIFLRYCENYKWGGRWDLNPQPSVPQTDALTN